MCWAVELNVLQCIFIRLQDAFDTFTLRVKDVTIESKAVRCGTCMLELCTKAKCWELFVGVVILQNIPNRLKRLIILIFIQIPCMQRIMTTGVTIAQCEVNSNS